MTLTLLPDIEALLSAYLRSKSEVTALVGQNVYTAMPNEPASKFPLVVLTRISGGPLFTRPLVVDQARIQVDCWGGPKKQAWTTAATIMALLSEDFIGVQTGGIICGTDLGALIDQPDTAFDPPQPRWLFDVTITAKPGQN